MKFKDLALAIAAMACVSCIQETPESAPATSQDTAASLTITAYAPGGASSKTMVENGGTKVLWQPGDRILVYNGSGVSNVFESTNTEPAAVAEFKAVDPDPEFVDIFESESRISAVYPARDDLYGNGNYILVPFEGTQIAVPGSFAPGALVTYAASETRELHFQCLSGGIRFTLEQEGVERVDFDGIDNYGRDQGAFSVFPFESESNSFYNPYSISLVAPDGETLKPGEWYYVAMAPTEINSFSGSFFKKDSSFTMMKIDKTVKLKAGTFGSIPKIDRNLTYNRNVRDVLMDIYYALDGPNWEKQKNWGSDKDISEWEGIKPVSADNNRFRLVFSSVGLKGTLPECIGELGGALDDLSIYNEPDLTGPVPESIVKLNYLRSISISQTSITSISDVFAQMPSLKSIFIYNNPELTGPLYESIGQLPNLRNLFLNGNRLYGSIPSSYARFDNYLRLNQNCLTGKIPESFYESEYSRELLYNTLYQKPGYGFDVSDHDLPGYALAWKKDLISDLDGNLFSIADVVGNSKYTVYMFWAPWCPFSQVLMPQLRDYYEKYRQDGLEVIATVQVSQPENGMADLWEDLDGQKREIAEKGYDQWYNFFWKDYFDFYFKSTPNAEVYDQNGNVVFSSVSDFDDPVRDRFGKAASTDLIPFLETLFGPAEVPDAYISTDFSKDGQVMTLQSASVGNGINIVFMGDAFTDKDMDDGGLYETTMTMAMEEFFAREPYKTYRNRFNVYAVKVVSKNGRIGEGYETALGTRFYSGTETGGNDNKCLEYALKVPGISSRENLLVSVIINTRRHAGTAYMYQSGQYAVTYTPNYGGDYEFMGSTLRHEAGGHGFAFLADEYYTSNSAAPHSHIDHYNQVYNDYGWFANVDFTNDPEQIRWAAFLADERYNGQIGIYEGGGLYAKGAYRPSADSIMNNQVEDMYNAPSRLAIYKRIMELSGEAYSFEGFLEYDAVNRGAAAAAPRRAAQAGPRRHLEHTAPPVIMPKD